MTGGRKAFRSGSDFPPPFPAQVSTFSSSSFPSSFIPCYLRRRLFLFSLRRVQHVIASMTMGAIDKAPRAPFHPATKWPASNYLIDNSDHRFSSWPTAVRTMEPNSDDFFPVGDAPASPE